MKKKVINKMVNEERRINSLDYAMYEFLDQMGRTDLAKDLFSIIMKIIIMEIMNLQKNI